MQTENLFSDPGIQELYGDSDFTLMRHAGKSAQPGKNRLEEIMTFARESGVKKIGIANCVAFQKEADCLKEILSGEFEVIAVSCKTGQIPKNVFSGENTKGISCNPSGQAFELARRHTELNIALGLCVGHDMIFNVKSKAPVTTLLVKDRYFRHNPFRIFHDVDGHTAHNGATNE